MQQFQRIHPHTQESHPGAHRDDQCDKAAIANFIHVIARQMPQITREKKWNPELTRSVPEIQVAFPVSVMVIFREPVLG
jgi:hypothetical protein